jgi:hypothetical protein
MNSMDRFDGNAARQLELSDDWHVPAPRREGEPRRPALRMLRKDVYAELARRRRHAQIAARKLLT